MTDAVRETLLARVYDVAVETPLRQAAKLTLATGSNIYLKREDMQSVHSFKIRGAYNKIISLTPEERARGVIAASAGNHAQGVALSCHKLGIKSTIVMPRTTPAIKVEAVRNYGADVILEGDSYSDAYTACQQLVKSGGMTLVHPFDDRLVIAGQGTIGKEILEQLPTAEYIFVPIGGGGLIAGVAQYVKALQPSVKIIGVEPEDSNAMGASLQAGKRVILPHVGVFADGVAVKQVGELTFELCRQFVDEVITVNNDQICAAIKSIFEDTRSIVEPAGALGVAGAVSYAAAHNLKSRNLIAICSGANITFEKLQFIAERTLLGSGREALFDITLPETPGALSRFCTEIVNGHNISEFSYRLTDRDVAHVFLGISIAGAADKLAFTDKMERQKYDYQDLSSDDIAKEHIRHMIGGPGTHAQDEQLYEINFPERPRALAEFLHSVGDNYNISLFHYRGQGGDVGRVFIGFETAAVDGLEQSLQASGYEYEKVDSAAAKSFL